MRQTACCCGDGEHCRGDADCPYTRIFKPVHPHSPEGMADAPRPFVFRTRHLDGTIWQPGEPFHIDVHLFTLANEIAKHFVTAFSHIEAIGFGPERSRATLERVTGPSTATLALGKPDTGTGTTHLRVDFVTPTELKHCGAIVEQPSFAAVWSRTVHRLDALQRLYGGSPLGLDFTQWSDRARQIRLSEYQIQHIYKERRSSRTGQVHPLGGFLGWAAYEGSFDSFLAYLQAAHWTGIGRQTVWGKGEIALGTTTSAYPLL